MSREPVFIVDRTYLLRVGRLSVPYARGDDERDEIEDEPVISLSTL